MCGSCWALSIKESHDGALMLLTCWALNGQVVNRLQRELETVLSNYRILEKRLEAEGIDLRSISQLAPLSTDTECVLGQSEAVLEL
jgi:hypothetical protein